MPNIKKDFDSYKVSYDCPKGLVSNPVIILFNKGKAIGEIGFYVVQGEFNWSDPPVDGWHTVGKNDEYITIFLENKYFDQVYALLRSESNLEVFMRNTSPSKPNQYTAMIRMKSPTPVGGK